MESRKCFICEVLTKERLLEVLRHRLKKAKDERSKCSGLNLLAYQEAKGKVSAYVEMIALVKSGNFDKGEE